jgi:hypothetical protein
MTTPEQRARETIDAKLAESGWRGGNRVALGTSRASRLYAAPTRGFPSGLEMRHE